MANNATRKPKVERVSETIETSDGQTLILTVESVPTPAAVDELLEGFRDDFDRMVEDSRDFLKAYAGRI